MRWFAELCSLEPDAEHVRRWATEILLRAGAEAADRLWETSVATQFDQARHLHVIQVPTLIIRGSEDRLTPAATVAYIASQIAGSRLATIPGAGHVPSMTRPREVANAVTQRRVIPLLCGRPA